MTSEAGPEAGSQEAPDVFVRERGRLVGVAYRIVGTVTDAEDVVQEAWLRWARVDHGTVADPTAYLVRTVTRLAIDRLRRVRARREVYVGPWLPEPMLTGPATTAPDPAADVERAESVSMAMLVVLETMSPLERAVFVLHDVFGYSHAEVADVLGRRTEAVRQLAHRGREHVRARRPRIETDPEARREATRRFLEACVNGDLTALLELLDPEATLVADSGGRTRAPRRTIVGSDRIARFLVGISASLAAVPARITEINGGPALIARTPDGPAGVAILDLDPHSRRVVTVRFVTNPDKLAGTAGGRQAQSGR